MIFGREAFEIIDKEKDSENAILTLKTVNPHKALGIDCHTPAKLLDLIEAKGREITEALVALLPSPLTLSFPNEEG